MPLEWKKVDAGNDKDFRYTFTNDPLNNTYICYPWGANPLWKLEGTSSFFVERKDQLIQHGSLVPSHVKPGLIKISKPFDVRGRAADTKPGAEIYARPGFESPVKDLAKKHGATLVPWPPGSTPTKLPTGMTFQRQSPYGVKSLTRSPQPARPAPKFPSIGKDDLEAWHSDTKPSSIILTKGLFPGPTKPARTTAMGGWSADEYAKDIDEDNASGKWEWLHLVAHCLGGANEKKNLVCGTFDANTQMIPLERHLQYLATKLVGSQQIKYTSTAKLINKTHIAESITVDVIFPTAWSLAPYTNTYDTLQSSKFEKLSYDVVLKALQTKLKPKT